MPTQHLAHCLAHCLDRMVTATTWAAVIIGPLYILAHLVRVAL